MAVAVKNASEAAPQNPLDRPTTGSLVAALYVLGSIGVVFYAIPWVWGAVFGPGRELVNSFVDGTFLLLAMIAGGVGLGWLGAKRVNFDPPRGVRAGIFVVCAGLAAIALTAWCVGTLLEKYALKDESLRMVGLTITLAVVVGLGYLGLRKFMQPSTEEALIALEDQGWFSLAPYKKSQGQRVRRGTILGILVMAGCGIWVLVDHKTLVYGLAQEGGVSYNHWFLPLPFTGGQQVMLLRDVRFTVPLFLTAFSLWFAYRLVNFPAFADFLIATEAEMNKVSWTSRKRLFQDTMVVLVTVVLMTIFLAVVDLAWYFLLTQIGVLQKPNLDNLPQKAGIEQPW
jgi:preprotein translocase SecE subunit